MTTLLQSARKLVTKGTDLGARIEGIETAVEASRGRLDDELLDEATRACERATGRLRLSAQHTVVAIAGATGSGKSTTFNALTGLELSSTGVRRPTTSWATACVWGSEGAEELLQWLGIPPRHQTMRESMLDSDREDRDLEGVVLLDLPDHDSTEVSHHLEVDRLVELADLLVWVLDPQKYADAAVHDRYLAPLKSHAGVMVVVLNHIDTVPEDRRAAMVDDVRRLLDADGLAQVPVFPVSSRHGTGMAELRGEVAGRVAAKKLTRSRIEADLKAVAGQLSEASGDGKPRELSASRVRQLDDALAASAGVPVVVDAVERSTKLRAGRATTWPVVSWAGRLKPDPLKRLHLDLGSAGSELTGTARTSLPETTPVQRAKVDSEVRALADDASAGLGAPWVESVRRASTSRVDDLGDQLDAAMARTDLGVERLPVWAGLVRALQWLLILVALAGAVWSFGLVLGGSFSEAPQVVGVPVPFLMLVGGIVLGVLLALVCRVLVAGTARARAAAADERLRAGVHEVSQSLVVEPVAAELEAYAAMRTALKAALR